MTIDAKTCGMDIPIGDLVPLNKRDANFKNSRGYRRLLATITAVGLIEPLAVYPENGRYVILNGFMRYKVCEEIGVTMLPCRIYQDKDAYTFNHMVNNISGFQEMRMLRKSLDKLDEQTVADVFGLKSIRYRLAPTLLKQLHPQVAKAYENESIGRNCVKEMTSVLPDRQVEILKEMKTKHNYSLAFLRALILGTPEQQKNPHRSFRKAWSKDPSKRKLLVARLDEAARQHDFYSSLYRRYSTDLLKICFYVRQLLTNPGLAAYLEGKQPDIFSNLKSIVFETPG
ncbi:MAG: ParB N-terminal domain-containing protein [bacterium]